MSLGGFYLDQFKITYNTTLFPTRLDYGIELISKYANAIIGASSRGNSYWSIDTNNIEDDCIVFKGKRFTYDSLISLLEGTQIISKGAITFGS